MFPQSATDKRSFKIFYDMTHEQYWRYALPLFYIWLSFECWNKNTVNILEKRISPWRPTFQFWSVEIGIHRNYCWFHHLDVNRKMVITISIVSKMVIISFFFCNHVPNHSEESLSKTKLHTIDNITGELGSRNKNFSRFIENRNLANERKFQKSELLNAWCPLKGHTSFKL